ncbi:hypothetical protein AOQ84DRAFT_410365 [Glonium stellatum]|uniref:Uncharacterized protein n=1 Tax=Glonium stellatum TaxID=574774 RepID=A0A8E2JR94_9PEZI|nr:hypothetical protein AOQ84DRAFT_410365 [Glonium stellatum]
MFSIRSLLISLVVFLSTPVVLGWASVEVAASGLEFDSASFPLEKRRTGWQAGPSQRGTITIIWSCLSTMIACTWTILHLNVPQQCDSGWRKFCRKTKWMITTILFPEFIFSKAVCELQMAVNDLYDMKEKERKVPATINSNKGSTAKAVTHPSTYSYDPDILPDKERTWTLIHSYFANMGGFERYRNPVPYSNTIIPVTTNALVNCCVGSDHDPLPTLALNEKDIEDKSKADWFVKSIAVIQISWLLLSVIVRAVRKLPISQLEICTSAFAILAIATYFANWSKPKDVGAAVRFRIAADTYQCEAQKYHGEPFFLRQIKPSETLASVVGCRIENDFVRIDGWLPTMAIAMAISTAVFGGLHCLAWNFEFPTEAELGIWMVASVLSATIPTFALLLNITFVTGIHRDKLESAISPRDRASRLITIVGGLFYAVIRMLLLVLTFCAFRSVPEGLFIGTWTRFLPSIS